MRELDFFVPNLDEQTEIITLLQKILDREQKVREIAESVIEKIDSMKKVVLARAFRGELGTNNPDEENALELLKEML